MERIFDLPVSEPWFSYIRSGLKVVEGKKRSPTWEKLQKGDKEYFYTQIVNINIYKDSSDNLGNYLKAESLERTLPGINNFEEARKIYLTEPVSWTNEEINKYGIMALQLRLV